VEAFVVAVAVATLWASPGVAVSLSPARSLRLSTPQRLALVGRIETQVLYGEPVLVLARRGEWVRVAVPDQPSSKDPRGYPGWMRVGELSAEPIGPPAHVVTAPTREFGSLVAGPGALLPRTGVDVVRTAQQFVGVRYLWGGTSPYGFDCSGLAWSAYRARGVTIPRDSQDQARAGRAVKRLVPGDLVFYGAGRTHVAIYGGGGRMIEAPDSTAAVRAVPLRPGRVEARRYV
jgi:cell wall-associated NlpC family hydrolase